MNIFDELEAQYNEIDSRYSFMEFDCGRRGWHRKKQEYRQKREINDQAYFVFMFSRLENRIREESARLIRKKKRSISSWKQRASWDILPEQSFLICFVILTERITVIIPTCSHYAPPLRQ